MVDTVHYVPSHAAARCRTNLHRGAVSGNELTEKIQNILLGNEISQCA